MGFEPDIRKILAYVTEDSTPLSILWANHSSSSDTHAQCHFSQVR